MKRGIGHSGARKSHRTDHSLGGEHSGTAHLDLDVLHHRLLDFRRIFIGCRPPGEFGGTAQLLPQSQVIHLDNRPVNITGKALPAVIDRLHFLLNFFHGGQKLIGDYLKAEAFQVFQRLAVAGKGNAVCKLDVKNQNIQSPLCGNLRIQLAQGTGSGVPGIGKEGLPRRLLGSIQLFKAFFRHIYLAPDNQPWRGIFNGHGNRADGF